jgi:hypothetical protein
LYSNNRGMSNEIIMERNPSFQNKNKTTTSDVDVWGSKAMKNACSYSMTAAMVGIVVV